MRVDDMRLQFGFYYWATGETLKQAEQLTPEHFSGAPPIGGRSVRDLLVHLLDVEVSWREGWRSGTHRADVPFIEAEEFASVAELRERWRIEEQLLRESLDNLTDADLDLPFIDGADWDARMSTASGRRSRSRSTSSARWMRTSRTTPASFRI